MDSTYNRSFYYPTSYFVSVKEILQELRSELMDQRNELKDQRNSTDKLVQKLRIQMAVNTVVVGMVAGGMSLIVAQSVREWSSSVQEFV